MKVTVTQKFFIKNLHTHQIFQDLSKLTSARKTSVDVSISIARNINIQKPVRRKIQIRTRKAKASNQCNRFIKRSLKQFSILIALQLQLHRGQSTSAMMMMLRVFSAIIVVFLRTKWGGLL